MHLNRLSIRAIRDGIRRKEFSCQELAEACLKAATEHDARIHSILHLDQEGLLKQAKAHDKTLAAGRELPALAGVVTGIKDNLHVAGMPTTCASKVLESFQPIYEATAVRRLKELGAGIIGKLNCDEFAMGSSNENSAFGPVRNPVNEDLVPGGSSGGSAAAVAGGFCHVSLGSDTGGSIRQPGSFCNVVGLKPTYGSVSRRGLVAFASSFDQIGPLAHSVEDIWEIFKAICGKDEQDASSLSGVAYAEPDFSRGLGGLRVGWAKEFFGEGVDEVIATHIKKRLEMFEKAGAKLVEVSLSRLQDALPVYYILSSAEASSNLARYDSIRYGNRLANGTTVDDIFFENRSQGFGAEVKRRILLGTYVLSEGYYDAYYLKAQKVRTLIRQDFARAFEKCDVLVGPTSPIAPFALGAKFEDALAMYMADILTVPASIAGIPALSLPAGMDSRSLPVGMQVMAPALGDSALIEAAHAMESAMKGDVK